MAVTGAEVAHIAELARLVVDEARLPELTDELNRILAHMDVLAKVDVARVCGASGVGDAAMPLRTDAGPAHPLARGLESFAPRMRDGFFLVPRLATHEGEEEQVGLGADVDGEGEHVAGTKDEQSRDDRA